MVTYLLPLCTRACCPRGVPLWPIACIYQTLNRYCHHAFQYRLSGDGPHVFPSRDCRLDIVEGEVPHWPAQRSGGSAHVTSDKCRIAAREMCACTEAPSVVAGTLLRNAILKLKRHDRSCRTVHHTSAFTHAYALRAPLTLVAWHMPLQNCRFIPAAGREISPWLKPGAA